MYESGNFNSGASSLEQMQQEEEQEAPSTEGSTGSRDAPDPFQSIPRGRRRPIHQSSPCLRPLHTSAGTGRDSRDSQASPTASPGEGGNVVFCRSCILSPMLYLH